MPHDFHRHPHQGDRRHGRGQGQGHGQAGGEQGAIEDHAPQGDEIHLGEVDDAHGVVHHPEAQGHQGVDGAPRQAGKNELNQILNVTAASLFAAPGLCTGPFYE